jgi:hypothetical protein
MGTLFLPFYFIKSITFEINIKNASTQLFQT